jgi:RNA polymerase sigma-70 factor (ECF subfamily)
MEPTDKTSMGGKNEAFQTTRWSEIRNAQSPAVERKREIIDKLLTRYWKPVYCYLRRKGYDNEEAKDLTQGFIHEIVIGKDLIQQSDETKGRFRTFLLTTLDRYVTDVHRYKAAQKRSPAGKMLMLESAELLNFPVAHARIGLDQVFHYAWAADLLNQVIATLKDEYCSTGKVQHWEVFSAKVLIPIFNNVDAPPLVEICKKCGVDTESIASNMILTVKRRFRSILRRYLRQLVQTDSDVDQEFTELLRVLSMGAGS